MTSIVKFSHYFESLSLDDVQKVSKQPDLSISTMSENFQRILNISELVTHKPSSKSVKICVNRVPEICEYSLVEFLDPTLLDRTQMSYFKIFIRNNGNVSLNDFQDNVISGKNGIKIFFKALFDKSFSPFKALFDKSFSPLSTRYLEPEFSISIPRNLLFQISDIRDIVQVTLLRELNPSEILQIRVTRNPNSDSHCLVELIDPDANYLSRCNKVFLKMFLFPNKTARLDEFVAPSFSGQDSMNLLKKLKHLTGTSAVSLFDISVCLPCNNMCNLHALTPLRSVQVLKNGSSWFERVGAITNVEINNSFFETYVDGEYERTFEANNSLGKESPLRDYRKFASHSLTSMRMMFVSPVAYYSSKEFISTLNVLELRQWLVELMPDNKIILNLKVLDNSISYLSGNEDEDQDDDEDLDINNMTLGELFYHLENRWSDIKNNQVQDDFYNKYHTNLHLFRDIFISHRNSLFLGLASKKIKVGDCSPLNVAISTYVLGEIPILDLSKGIKEIEDKIRNASNNRDPKIPDDVHEKYINRLSKHLNVLKKCDTKASIAYTLLFGDQEERESVYGLYEDYSSRREDTVLRRFQNSTRSSFDVKVMKNSNEAQRRKWRTFSSDKGIDNYIGALLPALKWLVDLPIHEFKCLNPDFFINHQHTLPDTIVEEMINSPDLRIYDLIQILEKETSRNRAKDFLGDMLLEFKSTYSIAFVALIEEYKRDPKQFRAEHKYIIWKLAQLTVDQHHIFSI